MRVYMAVQGTSTMNRSLAAILVVLVASNISTAELVGSFPIGGGNITVEPTEGPIQAGGIEFAAASGVLIQGPSAAPFQFFIPNSAQPGNVTLGSLGTPVTIDGPIELDVAASADATGGDILARWGKGVTPIPFPINGEFGRGFATLGGEYPTNGGPISIFPSTDFPVSTRGLLLNSTSGELTGGENPAPFETVIENTPQRWSIFSSQDVLINGCLLYTSPSPRDKRQSRMPSSA